MNTREDKKTTKKSTTTSTKKGHKKVSSPAARRRRKKEAMRKRRIKLLVTGLFLGVCIALLIFSIYKLASIFLGYHSGDKEYDGLQQYVTEEPASPQDVLASIEEASGEDGEESDTNSLIPMSRIDLASLQAINPEAVGWIEIPGTAISYPLLHTSDNSYYLSHTFRDEKNSNGSIFIETSNAADFSDLHTIIYGHNMKSGSMFGGLKNFQKESYFEEHPYVYVDLADGSHCYEIFSCHQAEVTDVTYSVGYSADDIYASFLNDIKAASVYDTGVDVGVDDQVITLSTCTSGSQKRFVVHAKKLY